MRHVNIADAKAHLSEYLREVKKGETIVICERNVPIAHVTAIGDPRCRRAPVFGTMKGRIWIAKDAFDPMTDAELADWERPIFPVNGD